MSEKTDSGLNCSSGVAYNKTVAFLSMFFRFPFMYHSKPDTLLIVFFPVTHLNF